MAHVALVGGFGFIGHHLALALRRKKIDVTIIDDLEVNSVKEHFANARYMRYLLERRDLLAKAGAKLIVEDARDYHRMTKYLASPVDAQEHYARPDFIVHLAAVAHDGKSNKDPLKTFSHSQRTLENVLDANRGRGDEQAHVIFFSSSMVYGNFETESVNEDHPLEPIGVYGSVKLGCERIVRAYGNISGTPWTIVRPSALYGPRCVSRRVVQAMIEDAMDDKPITLEGDGNEKLDFTYVDDVVNGILAIMENASRARGQIFNLTRGNAFAVGRVAEMVCAAFPGTKINRKPKPPLLAKRGTLCMDKMSEVIGFEPEIDFKWGFEKYLEWYKKSGRK